MKKKEGGKALRREKYDISIVPEACEVKIPLRCMCSFGCRVEPDSLLELISVKIIIYHKLSIHPSSNRTRTGRHEVLLPMVVRKFPHTAYR